VKERDHLEEVGAEGKIILNNIKIGLRELDLCGSV
jgi:hypothetical protein